MTDTTSMCLVSRGVQPNVRDGPNLLYNIVAAVAILNNKDRFAAFAPLDVNEPLAASAFADKFESSFGRRAPPQALLQAMRATLARYGQGNHFENSAFFLEDMGHKCIKAWEKMSALHGDDVSDFTLAILRRDLGLGPFVSQVVARFLALVRPSLYNLNRRDVGQYARMGLGMLSGMDQVKARAFARDKKRGEEADSIFARLMVELPEAVRKMDTDSILARLEDRGLFPLIAQTVEHMLCEFRKCMAPEGRHRGGRITSEVEYRNCWLKVEQTFANHKALREDLPQKLAPLRANELWRMAWSRKRFKRAH